MIVLDMRGQACPIPVVEAKKSLALPDTHAVLVRVDNVIAVQNLEKMARALEYGLSYTQGGDGAFDVAIQKDPNGEAEKAAAEAGSEDCRSGSLKNLVVVIANDVIGSGEEALGRVLMKSFIYSLAEADQLPSAVIFMNKGAYLTAEGSNTVPDLKTLEKKGTGILTCGACSDYYGLKDRLAVGSITNMYEIVERMTLADATMNL